MPKKKLSLEDVQYIRKHCVFGDPNFGVRALARKFGVLPSTVNELLYKIESAPCPYNRAIDCIEQSKCKKCGWNPDVENKRKERLEERENKPS